MYFLYKTGIFHCHVSLPEGINRDILGLPAIYEPPTGHPSGLQFLQLAGLKLCTWLGMACDRVQTKRENPKKLCEEMLETD